MAAEQIKVDALELLKGKETTVTPEDEKALKKVLENEDALFKKFLGTSLEKNVKDKMGEILKEIDPQRLRAIYEKLTPEQRKNLETIFKKLENKENEEKVREINTALQSIKVELENFRGQVMAQNAAKVENFKNKAQLEKSNNHKEAVSETNSSNNQESISKTEKKNLNKILDGDFLVEEKFNKVEKGLRSDFRKLIDLVENTASLKRVFNVLKAQADAKHALPDWSKLFVKENGEQWTEKELNKLQKAYLAYLESKKDNADTARWNRVMNALESGIINGEKSLDVIYQENVSKPISKKERKQGLEDEQWKFRLELAKDGKASEWKNNYMQQNREEIQDMQQNWLYEGYVGSEISQMTKDYLNDRFDAYTKKEWKKHLKEEQKNWIQKSDLGNFRILVDSIKDQGADKQISALLTDTNFDGVRNHLDGRGTKRGDQIDLAIRMAQAEGLSMDAIARNIVIHLHTKKEENFGGAVPGTADTFAAWLRSDIKHARLVQSALMDTPENAVDIMRYGENALKKTLEAQKLTQEELKQISDKINTDPANGELSQQARDALIANKVQEIKQEELKQISDKINTDPATRELSQQARDTLMANLSSYLLSKMREPGVKANVNGLGVGVNVPLNQILKGLSFTLGTGASLEGQPFAWISVAWNTEVAKWDTGNVSAGINAGTTLGVIPIYGLRAGVKQDLNAQKVLGNIDPTSLKSLSVGGNMTMLGAIPSWGVSAGIDKDKIGGIEKQYDHIKKEITPIIEKLLTKDKDGNYPDITATLKTLFKTSSDAEIKKAAENLTSVIERTKAENLDPKEAAQLIGERYAESWRDNAIQGLPKGWRFTGASLGAQFLAGFFPVATLSATLTKYKNLSHSDSPESRARLQQSIDAGRGDRTRESIQKQDFDNIRNQLQAINVLNSNDMLNMNENWELVLSLSLLNKTWFKVKINENLKGYIKSENGTLIIPAGVSYRFLTSARTNGSISELDIGYEGAGSRAMKHLNSDFLKEYVGLKDYGLDQNIKGLAKSLTKLGFYVATNGETFKHIVQKNDIRIDLDGKIHQGTQDHQRKEIWTLTKDSGLAIDKDWNIKIINEKGKITQKKETKLKEIANPHSELHTKVDQILNPDIIKQLEKLDDGKGKRANYINFMKSTKWGEQEVERWDSFREGFITRLTDGELKGESKGESKKEDRQLANYWHASEVFLSMLPEGKYNEIRDALKLNEKGTDFENPELATQIIDRIKAIFATIPDEQKNSWENISKLAKSRDQQHKKYHKGMSVLQSFVDPSLAINYVDLKDKPNGMKVPAVDKPNLIGFTAFYRINGGEARGMSMTAYGQTKVLGDTFEVKENDQKNKVQKWVVDNLTKYPVQQKMIRSSIENAIKTIDNQNKSISLSDQKITNLLKWESIDLWKKKITLNTQIVKYFLAECANESIGIQIDGITIEDSQQIEQQPTKMTFNASEATAQANIDKSQFSLGVSFGWGKKEQKKDQKEKTQWGEAPKTQWGDNGEKKGDVNNSINVGDHVEGRIPTGDNISPNNPWEVDGIPWNNPISNENPLWL